MMKTGLFRTLLAIVVVFAASAAHAQQAEPEYRVSFEVAVGWDNSISGNINSSGTGRINGLPVVVLKNQYESVYGTGLHVRFGGGYMMSEKNELRFTFTLQSLDADLVLLGEAGGANLYGQYDDYQSMGFDVGLRRYEDVGPNLQAYGEGTAGVAFIDETDVILLAPAANLTRDATDFYDRTQAFTFGANAGLLWNLAPQFGVFTQLGVRYVSGMSEVDGLIGTGLDTINDNSARWTFPFLVGVRTRF